MTQSRHYEHLKSLVAEQKRIPWIQIAVEGAAIVISILLAFSIDAWWQERLERLDELQELERLQTEFETNISGIDQFSVIERASNAAHAILVRIINAESENLSSIEIDAGQLYLLTIAPTFEAESPVLDGLA